MSTPMIRRSVFAIAILAVVGGMHHGICTACETPVYRYAMYRWLPTPYEVYFFHDKPASGEHEQVAQRFSKYTEEGENRANLMYMPISLTEDPELNSIPPDIKKIWEAREDKAVPGYVVATPFGIKLFTGSVDSAEVDRMIDSPARKLLAKELEAGKVGVFVMLSGPDRDANKKSEEIIRTLMKGIGEGDVNLYASPNDPSVAGDSPSENPKYEFGLVKVDRESEEEQWLVRSLLAVEPGLDKEEQPMVFLVYGRARALLPYIGPGITRENLIREVEFITGACSCTVKEQNPGVDLLVRHDWETSAALLAEKFGSEEGNESQFGPDSFFPELIIPSSSAQSEQTVASLGPSDEPADDEIEESRPGDDTSGDDTSGDESDLAKDDLAKDVKQDIAATTSEDATPPEEQSAPEEAIGDDAAESTAATNEVATTMRPTVEEPTALESGSGRFTSIFVVGAGVAVALVVLFGLTLIVMRPQ